MNTEIKIKLLYPNSVMPSKGKSDDAAYDLTATSVDFNEDGSQVTYGLGIATEIPKGWVGLVFPRSSAYKQAQALSNCVGVIDAGYRGEWKAVFNTIEVLTAQYYDRGDRVAQVIFKKLDPVELVQAESLSESERGEGGFGSTGK